MVSTGCPRLVIAGTGSGVGKTSIALGLARLLARQGRRVQTFKVGPDFLDPTYLALASGRACYNLDGWMTSPQYVRELFDRTTADADVALVEGVMGLFDGASATTLEGSTAEIARWLDAPVLLVVNAHGAARSVAATVKGFCEFESDVRVAGVVANHSGTDRHRAVLAEALAAAGLPPLAGAIPRETLPTLPSRHLGLVTADEENLGPSILDRLADACERYVDVGSYVDVESYIAGGRRGTVSPLPLGEGQGVRADEGRCQGEPPSPLTPLPQAGEGNRTTLPACRIGLARDAAFHFYYPDNLESLAAAGVQWVPFSPLADGCLPAGLDGIYLGGGYPEIYAEPLSANASMRAEIRRFADSGRFVYAECGGMMYLGRSITTLDGRQYPMAGVLPLDTAMLPRLKTMGYTEVAFTADSPFGPAGQVCRGHEFHYSEIIAEDAESDGWRRAYTVHRRRGGTVGEGLARGNVLAGYVHLHWASRPQILDTFVSRLEPCS
jgi:cobyrinic acid a,c-diamide synthase